MPQYSPAFPKPLPDTLRDCLSGLGHFIYYPNPGNLGDELIALASVQLFRQLGLSFEMYEEGRDYVSGYTLVYGGGGVMMPEWGYLGLLETLFTAPGLARCVVLSHSMHDCPELLRVMDERFTVFLREQRSLDYARASGSKAEFLPSDDMVFYLDPRQLPDAAEMRRQLPRPSLLRRLIARISGRNVNLDHTMMLTRFYAKTHKRINRRLPMCLTETPEGRVAFFMRRDQEQQDAIGGGQSTLDLSRLGGSACRWHEFNLLGVTHFLEAIDRADIIVSDRLHVSVAAAMLGKRIVMLDNSYGKLSGVYERSMSKLPGISFCRTPEQFRQTLQQLRLL